MESDRDLKSLLIKTGRDLNTTSGRLNALMDVSGEFPPEIKERVKLLGEQYGASSSSAYSWLNENRIPKRSALTPILETIILSLEGDYSLEAAIAWLEFGNAVPSLFLGESITTDALSQDEIAQTFRTVVRISRELGVPNLDEALPEEVFDNVVREVLTDLSTKNRPRKPNEELVAKLLKDNLKASFFAKWSS